MNICQRPGCGDVVRHHPHLSGETFTGWAAVCCHHADEFMSIIAATVTPEEAETGWLAWLARHEAECGSLVEPDRG